MTDENWIIAVPDRRRTDRPSRSRQDERTEEAYLRWAMTPNKGRGCLVRLAQDLGVKLNTLRDWKLRYRWEARWINDIQGAKLTMLRESEAVLLTTVRPALERLGQIAVHGSDRDAVQAVKVMVAILGLDQFTGQPINLAVVNPVLLAQAKETSKGEMKRALAAIAQTNSDANRQSNH